MDFFQILHRCYSLNLKLNSLKYFSSFFTKKFKITQTLLAFLSFSNLCNERVRLRIGYYGRVLKTASVRCWQESARAHRAFSSVRSLTGR